MTDTAVADELAIRNTIAQLAFCADNPNIDDLDTYVALFTEDALWEMPGAPRKGRADIKQGAIERRQGSTGARGMHVVPITCVCLEGDTATAESYFQFFSLADKPPTLQLAGHYVDRFERTAEGWKLAHRKITFL